MDHDEVWHVIDAQRQGVADMLEQLSDDEWTRPSLCDGWTVRDVAAHLTLQQLDFLTVVKEIWRLGLLSTMRDMIKGDMDKPIHDMACRKAAAPTTQLIAEIREMVGSRKHNVGVTHLETLTDILVHGLDIAVPLGREHETHAEAAGVAATRMWELGAPFHAKKKLAGFRIAATDID